MIKRICTPLMVVLFLISLNALADSVPYTFGDFTIPIPDTLYVLTRDKHDVVELGLDVNISQHFANSIFESQPSLQIDCMRIDPFYEISVSQLPVTEVANFSELTPKQLEGYQNVLNDDIQLKQVDLTEEIQILSHSQTNFFYYAGTADRNGSTVYITAYVTCENNMITTIALQSYDSPADESAQVVLDDIVQGTVLNTAP